MFYLSKKGPEVIMDGRSLQGLDTKPEISVELSEL